MLDLKGFGIFQDGKKIFFDLLFLSLCQAWEEINMYPLNDN